MAEDISEVVERIESDLAETCPPGSHWSNALVERADLRALLNHIKARPSREEVAEILQAAVKERGAKLFREDAHFLADAVLPLFSSEDLVPEPSPAQEHESIAQPRAQQELPADVVRLVCAARTIAFTDFDRDDIKELDAASEAFASRVPWDDEPDDELEEPSTGRLGHKNNPTQPDHAPGEGGWLPIDTATAENKHVLVLLDGQVCEARWNPRDGWWIATFNGQIWRRRRPSHWMPLPPLPQPQTEGGAA